MMPDLKTEVNVVCCTLRYSDNLGDGVIGDCFEFLIKKAVPDANVLHLDMAGRSGYSFHESEGRRAKDIFYLLPVTLRPLSTLLAWPLLLRPKIAKILSGTLPDKPFYLVFAGGQVLNDIALNFPLKFSYVVNRALHKQAKLAISGVGVSKNWSGVGKRIFRRALSSTNFRYMSVRDIDSDRCLNTYLPTITPKPRLTVDAAIWAGDVYSSKLANPKVSADQIRVIGLGVSYPEELQTQSRRPELFSNERLTDLWIGLMVKLCSSNLKISLFTNGSFEDKKFCLELAKTAETRFPSLQFEVAPVNNSPEDLVACVARYDAIVSHRLHANIIAYSLLVPSVALVCDKKVSSFAILSEREDWCVPEELQNSNEVLKRIISAIDTPVNVGKRDALRSHSFNEIKYMLKALSK